MEIFIFWNVNIISYEYFFLYHVFEKNQIGIIYFYQWFLISRLLICIESVFIHIWFVWQFIIFSFFNLQSIYKHYRNFLAIGDQEPDGSNHIYEEHYLASDDDDGIEDFDFPNNDTLYNGGFQIGESSNPNLGESFNILFNFSLYFRFYIVTNMFNVKC